MALIRRGLVKIDYLARLGDKDTYKAKFEALCAAIDKAPTVDAEPVRNGTWEMCRKTIKTDFATLTGTYPTCSLCGYVEYGVDKSTPYCPGCGAKMDGGATGNENRDH